MRFQDDGPSQAPPAGVGSLGLGALLRLAGLEVTSLSCCAMNCDGAESGNSLDLTEEPVFDSQPVIAFHEQAAFIPSEGAQARSGQAAAVSSSPGKRSPAAVDAAPMGGKALLTAAASASKEETLRNSWAPGSVLEVYSASLGCWLVALVTHAAAGALTIQFCSLEGAPLRKTVARSDQLLAPLGKHCSQALPSGLRVLPASPSQGGKRRQIFVEVSTGKEYASLEDAWRSYYEQLIHKWQSQGG